MKRIVLVTGGFDPIHSGHIELFKEARKLGDKLVVGVNSDEWLTNKKGKPFMSFNERANIIQHLDMVDQVIGFNDSDGTACHAIFQMLSTHGNETTIVFANGGDRGNSNTPEYDMYKSTYGVEFAWAVGGDDKKNSSSWILEKWMHPATERAWGTYTVLEKGTGWQVKQLAFRSDRALSDQRHFKRSEHWHIVEGEIKMDLEFANGYTTSKVYKAGDSIDIPKKTWHKATNVGKDVAKVIEVWMGHELTENDIDRRD